MNIDGFLNQLTSINAETLVDVYVPSKKGIIKFKPLTVKQQKTLVSAGFDGSVSVITITLAINDIIRQNSTESNYNFKVTDKIPVLLELRKQALGNKYTQEDVEFDLSLFDCSSLSFNDELGAQFTTKNNEIVVSVEIPSLKEEDVVLDTALKEHNKDKNSPISQMVGNLFVSEIIKFVKEIEINQVKVEFSKLSVLQRLTLIENLPVSLNSDILTLINDIRQKEMDFLTQKSTVLSIDSRFFSK
jgi:hypothetical protein